MDGNETALVTGMLSQRLPIALLASLAIFAPFISVAVADVRLIEEIIAKVNNEIVTRTEMEKMRIGIESELRLEKGFFGAELEKETKAKEADALEARIDRILMVQRGKDLNIKVEIDVTRWLAEIQEASGISDPDKFHEWIRQQFGGLSYEEVRQNKTEALMTQKVIGQEVGYRINVPQSEIQKYYDEHKAEFVRQEMVFLREILVAPADASATAWSAAEKKANDIVARARNNEKFSQLARDYSSAETARNDGELGSFKRGDLKKELEDRVFTRDKGYVTDAVKTDTGYLILKVEDRYAAGQASLDDVRNDIMDKLYTPRLQPALRAYLTRLREDAFLEIKPGYVDAGAAPNKDTTWKDPATLKPETTTREEVAARKHKKKVLGVDVPFTSSGGKASSPPSPQLQ
jgi:hypothetical protein